LEHRFETLLVAVSERLAHAPPTELEIWGDTVLTASTLEAVFVSLH
jgi:hypothetical protein